MMGLSLYSLTLLESAKGTFHIDLNQWVKVTPVQYNTRLQMWCLCTKYVSNLKMMLSFSNVLVCSCTFDTLHSFLFDREDYQLFSDKNLDLLMLLYLLFLTNAPLLLGIIQIKYTLYINISGTLHFSYSLLFSVIYSTNNNNILWQW